MRYLNLTVEPRRELSGWKEIADYLGVSVRTAQTLEGVGGLPVRRLSGSKGRVFAYVVELDAWKTSPSTGVSPALDLVRTTDASLADTSATGNVFSLKGHIWRWYEPLATILIIFSCFWIYFVWIQSGQPTELRVAGKNVIAVNNKGVELWRFTFPTPLREAAYSQDSNLRFSWIGDLKGDGHSKILFIVKPLNELDVGSTLMCLGANGIFEWQFKPDQPVTDVGGDYMLPPYFMSNILVVHGKSPANNRIVLSSNHYLSQPNQIAVLDSGGNLLGQYWHPGHLLYVAQADLDGDGRNEILLAGVNNGNHQATLVVLDPWSISGLMSPVEMSDQRFRLIGMSPAKEKVVVLFPRSSISKGQPYTRAQALHVTKDRVVVNVAEGAAEGTPGFVYELDYGLHVTNVVPDGVGVEQLFQQLQAKGKIKHPFDPIKECRQLKANVIIRKAL